MRRLFLTFLFFGFVALAGFAYELRIWEDVDGNQFEGRFLRELFGKLTIEDDGGNQKVFELEELSDLDQKYLRVMVPPELEAEVRTKSTQIPDRKQFIPHDEDTDEYVVTAVITKKSARPFTSRLKAEIFLVAEEVEGRNNILLSLTEKEFLLPVGKGTEVELKSKATRTLAFRDILAKGMKGEIYKGYLLIITTLQGERILVDSNLPSWMEEEAVVQNLRDLAVRGAPSVRSRHFDKTGKKVPPPRPPYASPWVK